MTTPKPPTLLRRVCRGGSWNESSATFVRAASRYDGAPTFRSLDIGFRLTQSGCRQQVLKVTP